MESRENQRFSVLFICMGNICRSPTAEVVFRHLLAQSAPELEVRTDSAGTAAYHVGCSPDARSQQAARRRGYDMSGQRARLIDSRDFDRFDLILAMDRNNLTELHDRAPARMRARLQLFLEFAPEAGTLEVPDPYYGGTNGFEEVLDLIEAGARGLIAHLRELARTGASPGYSSRESPSPEEGAEDHTT